MYLLFFTSKIGSSGDALNFFRSKILKKQVRKLLKKFVFIYGEISVINVTTCPKIVEHDRIPYLKTQPQKNEKKLNTNCLGDGCTAEENLSSQTGSVLYNFTFRFSLLRKIHQTRNERVNNY